MIPKIPSRSGISLKRSLMALFIIIILISLISITGYYYNETSRQIDDRFHQDLNQTELLLKSASDRITKGQMLWEATYKKPLVAVTQLVLEEYERSSRTPSAINFEEVLSRADPEYRDRIDVMLINASGVAEFATNKKDLNLDFSNWGPFYQTITDMRMNDSFRLDRAVRGFDTDNPWRIFAYQPTPDHQYLIETTYRIYDDYSAERNELSYNTLVTQVLNQHPQVLALDLIGSTGMIISQLDEIPVPADSEDAQIAQEIYVSQTSRDFVDEKNQTLTRFFFIDSGDNESPASAYIDHVAKMVFSTKNYQQEKGHLLSLALSLLFISIVLAFILAYLLSRFIFSPVDTLLEDLDEISKGNLNHPIRPSRHLEINRITDAVSQMVKSIRNSIRSLELSEKRYFSLFSNASDAIILWSDDGVVHANPAAYSLFGWDEKPEDKSGSFRNETIRNILGKKGIDEGEWDQRIEIHGRGARNLNIRQVRIILDDVPMDLIQIRDVTVETRMHEEIHRLADIVRNTQAGIMAGPLEAPHIVNEAYARMHECTNEEALKDKFFGPIHQDYKEDIPVWIRIATERGHMTGEAIRIRRDGSEFPALHDLTIMMDEHHEPYLILNVQDISDQIKVWNLTLEKEALSDSINLLSSILDSLPDPTFVIDSSGNVLAWNKAMTIFSGQSEEEIRAGMISYSQAVYGDERPMLIDKIIRPDMDISPYYTNVMEENGIYSAEVINHETGGKSRYNWALAGPLYDSKGVMIGAIETIRDITDLKEAIKKQSELANKLMLLSSLTRHDIRNKVTVIDGFRFFAESETQDPKILEILTLQKKAVQDIGKLIDFSKSYQEIGIQEPVWHNVRELFERAVRQVSFDLKVESDIPSLEVYADALIYQVFYNLAENSLRHGDHVTTIRLHADKTDGACLLLFEDDGQGISEKEKEQIFLRGYGKNTGLGLFLIREILAITGITIVENGISGQGVRFEMNIPPDHFRFTEQKEQNL